MDTPDFGIFSLLPVVITITAAFITKQVLLALFLGCFITALMLAGFNPILGLLNTFTDFVIAPLTPFAISVIILILIIGGFTSVLEKGGGATVFTEALSKKFNTRKQGQISAWVASCAIFFTDASPLIVGPILKKFTDKLKISREKLSYIIDSTGCTIPGMHPMSSWGAFIMGLIAVQFDYLNYDGNPFLYFLSAVPYYLYAWGAILMVLIIAITGFDYGPMIKAEKRAVEEGKVSRDGANLLRDEVEFEAPEGAKLTIWTMLLPVIVLVVSTLAMFAFTGGFLNPEVSLVDAFSRAQAVPSLIFSFFIAGMLGVFLTMRAKTLTLKEGLLTFQDGVKQNISIVLILIFAYGIGRATSTIGAPAFIISATEGFLTPTMLYITIFVAASMTSFSTGTSWGTFSIFIPISIPLAFAIGAPIAPAIAVAISGGLFGDHCSPISDTTIMSALGGGCDPMDHVSTQLPYALTAALASVIGYFFVGVTHSAVAGLASMLISLTVFSFILNKTWGVKVSPSGGA